MPGDPRRPHHGDHRTDQLVTELIITAVADQTGDLRGLHIPARGLAVHPGPLRRGAQTTATEPAAQHLSNLVHPNLPKRHPRPPRHQ